MAFTISNSALTNSGSTWGTWNQWNSDTSSTSTLSTCWISWNTTFTGDSSFNYVVQSRPSAEDLLRSRRQAGIRKAKVHVAREKADRLLRSLLNDEQIKMMEEEQRFFVMGQSGKLYEVLTNKTQHNVFEVEPNGNRRLMEFCIVAPRVPAGDHFAAQVLMLKTEEQEFYRQADVWRLDGNREQVHNAERQLYAA